MKKPVRQLKMWAYAFVLVFANNCYANIKSEMDSLANQAASSAETFMQQTMESRLEYEYQGFISESQSQNVRELARKTSDQLDDILQKQLRLKMQIENYSGEDWDSRYGDSGLWRAIGIDICNTRILKAQILYYSAEAAPGRLDAAQILDKALRELGGLPETLNIMLIKADIYFMLGQSDESSKKLAGELYRKVLIVDKVPDEIYYPAAIASQKLNVPSSPQVLDELAAKLRRSSSKDNFELYMRIAFLQRRVGSTAVLEETVKKWPQARQFIGRLVLADLSAQASPQLTKLTAFEADCAAAAALQDEPAKYLNLFEAMAQIPALQTVRVLSAAATANMQKSPAKAIAFFVKASRLPREPNDGYDAPSEIAQKAAVIAIDFSRHESANCELIKLAFENYFSVAKGRIDQQIQYSYSFVLSNCGNSSEAQKLLEKIASASDSKFSRSAKDDLARIAISKSQELFEAGKFCQAAKVLISADVNVSQCRGLAINLLSRYVDRIDENADSNFVEVFDELGRKAVECSDRQNRTYATTLYAQAAVFNAQGRKEKLANIEKLLNSSDKSSAENLDVLIARARLSGAQGNYEEAAKQWAAICEILKLEPNEPPQHSYHWWQAKYFELENSIKMPNAARVDVIHSIEVLQSSFKELPPFWDKKLKALRGAN